MKKLVILALLGFLLMSNVSAEKVVVVGFDGADWDYMEPLMEKGEMPNLKSIVDNGKSGDLESSYPVMSPVAWSSYSTGSDPSVHGIYDFIQRDRDGFQPTTSQNIQQDYFWNSLEEDKKSVVVNVPMTFPPSEINGALVSGYLASKDTTYTYPGNLTEKLNSDGYQIEALDEGYDEDREEEILDNADRAVEKRTEAAIDLYKGEDPKFFQVTYTALDRIQHYFLDEENNSQVNNHYKKVDEALGELKSEVDNESTIIVMSDHGFEPLEKEIYLNHWMNQKGYLETEQSESILGKLGITQQKVAPILRKMGMLDLAKDVMSIAGFEASESVPQPTMNDINLDETKAYAGNYGGGIYIVEENVDNPEEFKNNLIQELRSIEIEGESPFKFVKGSEEVYSDRRDKSPDILTSTKSGYLVVGFLGEGRLHSSNTEKSGKHSLNGIIATNNENIEISEPNITDVAPTVLDLLKEEKPDHMTGKSLFVE